MPTDEDFNDLQEYLEGDTPTAMAAAKRLDRRSVKNGQMSADQFRDLWNEEP